MAAGKKKEENPTLRETGKEYFKFRISWGLLLMEKDKKKKKPNISKIKKSYIRCQGDREGDQRAHPSPKDPGHI